MKNILISVAAATLTVVIFRKYLRGPQGFQGPQGIMGVSGVMTEKNVLDIVNNRIKELFE